MSANLERIEAVFHQALGFGPEARAAFLAGACGGDAALLAKVQALLQAHETAAGFLPEQPKAGATVSIVTEQPGDKIGHYKLLQKLGEGGCGVVYMAEQETPVRRRVPRDQTRGLDGTPLRFAPGSHSSLVCCSHPIVALFSPQMAHSGRW